MKHTPRSIALHIIEKVLASRGLTVKEQLTDAFSAHELPPRDKALATELAYGVLRNLTMLDWHIARCSDYGTIKRPVNHILRLGAYQLLCMDKVPAYAAINESVQMAKRTSAKSAGFVNAVLRKIQGRRDRQVPESAFPGRTGYLAARYSFPEWMIRRWELQLGGSDLEAFCAASNERPPLSVRVNLLRVREDDFKKLLEERGVAYERGAHPLVLTLRSSVYAAELSDIFDKGYFFVQDASTVRIVDLLDPRPGERVLDLCAAPGGKATYCAQLMRNEGLVSAVDCSPARMALLRENARRLGTTIVQPRVADALRMRAESGAAQFDRVLLDAPCSNQGVLAKRVEVRWRLLPADIGRLSALQLRLLCAAARFVRPRGVLVYSTCSIDSEEDESVVEKFLAAHPHYSAEKVFKTWPHSDSIDGAFAAKLVRST
jgi:16S rRNA (cytosine967-C5)-methyltransferase